MPYFMFCILRILKDKLGAFPYAMNQLIKANLLVLVGMFLFSMFLGWLLSLAYPQGITNVETSAFWSMQSRFNWFAPSPFDWYRTLIYGMVLKACSGCSNPTNIIYWLNTLIFSINTSLAFFLIRTLFDSIKVGIILALTSLLFEFAQMHMVFQNLQVNADPFIAELVYLGVLLALIAWLRQSRSLFLLAYAFVSLAIVTKPVGISLVPVFIGFAVFFWIDLRHYGVNCYRVMLVSIILLVAPLALLSARNYWLYGSAEYTGHGGISLLQAALPLLSPRDLLFEDQIKNAEFIAVTKRSLEKNLNGEYGPRNSERKPDWMIRNFEYKQWFLYGGLALGPFDYLAGLRKVDQGSRAELFSNSAKMFALEKVSGRIGLQLIAAHPLIYLKRVAREYIDLFRPLELSGMPWLTFQRDPDLVYSTANTCSPEANKALYPHDGKPNLRLINRGVASLLADITENPLLRAGIDFYYACELYVSHLIVLVALVFCCYARFRRRTDAHLMKGYRIAVTIVLLFFTAASTYFITALVEIATPRYSVGGGELELHLMFIIGIFALLRAVVTVDRRRLTQTDRLTEQE